MKKTAIKKAAPKKKLAEASLYPDRIAFENTLGLRMVEKHEDGVTLECPIRPDILNGVGVMHGGVLASIADEAAWHVILNQLGEKDRNMTTSELKINYLRPIAGTKVVARGYIVKMGRTLCVTRIDLMDDKGKQGALAIVTYMLLS